MEHDQHLNILLDIQKQLGDVKSETGRQSEVLRSLDARVAIQNSKTFALEKKVSEQERLLENWKGKLAIIVAISVFIVGAIRNIILDKLGL